MTTRFSKARSIRREAGFTLIEVMVTLLIVAFAVSHLLAILGTSVNDALETKINRQLKQLVQFQMGQITVGQLHPDEEDPFPDGQSGDFSDVGGYPEEYAPFKWQIYREEVAICGADNEEMKKAGFEQDGSGAFIRPETDDIINGKGGKKANGAAEMPGAEEDKPEGQFKTRVTLVVRWSAESQDEDKEFSITTYLPVKDEETQDMGGAGGAGGPGGPGGPGGQGNTPGAGGTPGSGVKPTGTAVFGNPVKGGR